MVGALTLYQTSIGKKVLMAVTGLVLFGFVFAHMYGTVSYTHLTLPTNREV